MHTYMTWIGMFVLYSALFGGEDDDDARKKWFKMYMMDNLAQQYNPVDIGRTFYNMTPVGAARA